MRILRLVRGIVVLVLLAMVSSSGKAQDENATLFQRNVETIAASFRLDLDIPGSLFGFPEFVEIWKQPDKFREAAIEYITNPNNPERNRKIAAYAAHSLREDDYFDLCDAVVEAYKDDRISFSLLEETVLPAFDFNTKLAENFDQKRGRLLLLDVRAELAKRSELRSIEHVDYILSGEAAANIAKMRCLGQLPDEEKRATLFCMTYLPTRIAGNLWNELIRRIWP